jgi:CrcB protein
VIAPSVFAWVALGGGLGAVLRLLISTWMASPEPRFPWATLFINIAGSFGIGLLWGLGQQQPWFEQWGRYLLVTGVLGGFTTFSAFSFETVALVDAGRYLPALVYVLASVAVCIIAAWAGLKVTGY